MQPECPLVQIQKNVGNIIPESMTEGAKANASLILAHTCKYVSFFYWIVIAPEEYYSKGMNNDPSHWQVVVKRISYSDFVPVLFVFIS